MALNALLHRERPSWWQRFQQAPYSVVAETLYAQRERLVKVPESRAAVLNLTVVCISDTHNKTPKLPPGDLLIHAGDLTQGGTVEELQAQLDWLNAQPHTHKVVIAGNHDIVLDVKKSSQLGTRPNSRQSIRWGSIVYLQHTAATLTFPNGAKVSLFGHPGTRKNGNWAFQHDRGADEFTRQVPDGTDILVTHSPPRFHLDGAGWGDEYLSDELWRVKPKLHVFGHIHEGFGRDLMVYDDFERLYEQVRAGNSGLLALMRMVLLLLGMLLRIGSDGRAKRTVLVNASATRGLTDTDRQAVQIVQL